MRISNKTDEPITIDPGDHVDCNVDMIHKNNRRIVEIVVYETQ